jgi:hypothetical protein
MEALELWVLAQMQARCLLAQRLVVLASVLVSMSAHHSEFRSQQLVQSSQGLRTRALDKARLVHSTLLAREASLRRCGCFREFPFGDSLPSLAPSPSESE